MRKPGSLIFGGLIGLVVGASSLMNGCEEPRGNYEDNQNQSRRTNDGDYLALMGFGLQGWGIGTPGGQQFGEEVTSIGVQYSVAERNRANINVQQTTNVNNGNGQQQVYAQRPTSQMERVWVDYDLFDENGNKGMKIHTRFKIYNVRGERMRLAAYFYNMDGTVLKDRDGQYSSADQQVSAAGSRVLSPNSDNVLYEDETIFMPYNQFDLINQGGQDLKFQIILWREYTEEKSLPVIKSDFVGFWTSN